MSDTDPGPHIVLVGLMGAGKTTIGRRLAAEIGRRFVDADDELEARSGRSIADWFAKEGEDGFRRAEAELLASLLDETEPMVLGSGGGVVVTPASRDRLGGDDVLVVYLHGTPHFLASRTPAQPHRPLLADVDPRELFREQYRIRDPWYRQIADLVVEIRPQRPDDEHPREKVTDRILEGLRELGSTPSEWEERT